MAEQDAEYRESLAADAARADSTGADAPLGEGGEGGESQSLRAPDRESLAWLDCTCQAPLVMLITVEFHFNVS